MLEKVSSRGALAGGILAAVGASACCLVPLVLVSVGIGGAWVSSITMLEPLQPVLLMLTVACFAIAYQRLFRTACAAGEMCVAPAIQRRQRIFFWGAASMVLPLVTFPWYAGLLY